jgi:hypothetical protein
MLRGVDFERALAWALHAYPQPIGPAIAHYLEQAKDGPVNLAALHDWLIAEHNFAGSLPGLCGSRRRLTVGLRG